MAFVPVQEHQLRDPRGVRVAGEISAVCAGCGHGLVELPRPFTYRGSVVAHAHSTSAGDALTCAEPVPVECRAGDCGLPASPAGGPWCAVCG